MAGATGATGAQGVAGPTGPTGPTGPSGIAKLPHLVDSGGVDLGVVAFNITTAIGNDGTYVDYSLAPAVYFTSSGCNGQLFIQDASWITLNRSLRIRTPLPDIMKIDTSNYQSAVTTTVQSVNAGNGCAPYSGQITGWAIADTGIAARAPQFPLTIVMQ